MVSRRTMTRRRAASRPFFEEIESARIILREVRRLIDEEGNENAALALIARAFADRFRAGYEEAIRPKKSVPRDPWWWEPMKVEVAARYPEFRGLPNRNALATEMGKWLENRVRDWPEDEPDPPDKMPDHTTLYRRVKFFRPPKGRPKN